jgi:hypothetical protein
MLFSFKAKPLLDNDQLTDLIDPSLGGVYNMGQVRHVACAAHLCVQHSPAIRPSMSQVLHFFQILIKGCDTKIRLLCFFMRFYKVIELYWSKSHVR